MSKLPVYNPRLDGARCDSCILGPNSDLVDRNIYPWIPVPAEINRGADKLIIAEAPGEDEEEALRPLVGASGRELMNALAAVGERRESFSFTNATCCRAPKNERDRLVARIERINARRRKVWEKATKEARKAKQPLPPEPQYYDLPEVNCRPRLLKELRGYDKVLALGAVSVKTLLGPNTSIMDVRGRPTEIILLLDGHTYQHKPEIPIPFGAKKIQVMPGLHPAFILHGNGRWRDPFRNDIRKGLRWFRGELNWKPPEIIYQPTAAQLEHFLFVELPSAGETHITWDTETGFKITTLPDGSIDYNTADALEPRLATQRCIAVGTARKVMVCGFESVDMDRHRLYPPEMEAAIWAVLDRFMADPPLFLSGHNCVTFDSRVYFHRRGLWPNLKKTINSQLLHRLYDCEMPHALSYVASTMSDAPAWKLDMHGLFAKSDFELQKYCSYDAAINHSLIEPMMQRVAERGQTKIFPIDQRIDEFCVMMSELGVPIDQAKVDEHSRKAETEMVKWRAFLQEKTGCKDFNPGSVPQVRDLLFDEFKLPYDSEEEVTKLGDPSTADVILRDKLICSDVLVSKAVKIIIKAIRRYRKAQKKLGTFLRPCRLRGQFEGGKTWPDGRLRASWSGYVATGRLACDDPNLMAWPVDLADVIVAPPGHVLVAFDLEQAEPRVAAAAANIRAYKDEFAKPKPDLHGNVFAELMFGEEYHKALGGPKEKGTSKYKLRQCGKIIGLASAYAASHETIYHVVTKAEDEVTGDLLFAHMGEDRIYGLHQALLDGLPELEVWWSALEHFWERHGYIAEPIHGRRRDFRDGKDAGAFANHVCQGAISAVHNDIVVELLDSGLAPNEQGHGTGIVLGKHDHLCAIVPESKAEWCRDLMARIATRTYESLPGVQIIPEVSIGRDWGHV